jgi:hypothetical protein
MQLHNISYNDPKVRRSVEAECGPAFDLWATIKRGGTGTSRFQLMDAPPAVLALIDRMEDRRFCSLEMRPNGLLVRMRNRLETLAVPLAWSNVGHVTLGSPNEERLAPLRILASDGESLLFAVNRDQWGSLDRLLKRSVPTGLYRTSAARTL